MTRATLEWYDLLARGLVWAAGIVLFLSLVGAVVIAGSDTALPLLEEAERQGRGILALAALGGGLTSAGVLGGLGAILRILVLERLARLGDEPERGPDQPSKREAKPERVPEPKREAKPALEPQPKRQRRKSREKPEDESRLG